MGVPKFYRWISERYPCLSQVVKDYQIPEFDNFYLDMNGIIHTCSHPNDDNPSFRITDDKIFSDIFHYLEVLFRIVKPQKVMFMAVDGVAPRAKMNQQRGRRFRSAKEAEDVVRKAISKGIVLPTDAQFDSNCITPGTSFMARLNEQLKYFINQKLATDPAWQKVEIILSGHEVPGEGEHKIMDYIRYSKSQPEYDSNTRHCLYGLDADLIMLGLVTHEPHFCLLREEVKFGKSAKRQTSVDAVTFHLLHLSILREYLDYEFASLKDILPFPYNLESIIDDWVLMGFFIGNDFIPNLPNMHIRQEVLPFLYQRYIETLPTLGGYLNENGKINLARMEKYLEALSQFDDDYFLDLMTDLKWMEGKKKERKQNGGQQEMKTTEPQDMEETEDVDDDFLFGGLNDNDDDIEDNEAIKKLKRDLGIPNLKAYFQEEDVNRNDQFVTDVTAMKAVYYQEKFRIEKVTDEKLSELAKCYIVGIQWVLSYYYTGVPSWSWFYPFHYAPFVSELKNFSTISIEFELGSPFLPFEQLLAVLPANSRFLLPEAYRGLMVNEDSPILEFYPDTFETDLNGKQHEWEAIVLIPFIDEERLLQAMKPCSLRLSDEEVRRNSHGPCLIYKYDRDAPSRTYPSPWPTQFPDVQNCKVRCEALSSNPYPLNIKDIVWGLCPSVKLDLFFPGFPTLKHVPHKPFLEARGVRIFQAASRGQSICLNVLPQQHLNKPVADIAKELVGKTCFVRWPHLIEAKVWSLSDGHLTYFDDSNKYGGGAKGRKVKISERQLTEEEIKLWQDAVMSITKEYNSVRGIDLGDINVLVYVEVLQGKRYVLDKSGPRNMLTLEKQWSASPTPYPLQIVVKDITEYAPEYSEKTKTLEELYEEGSQCFLLHPPYYGEQAEVISVISQQQKVAIKFKVQLEPEMESVIAKYGHLQIYYSPQGLVAQRLGLPTLVVARLSSSLMCEKGSRDNKKERERFNLGLGIKFSQRNQELIGYAKRTDRGWQLSPAAEDILKEYKERFPSMFKFLEENPSEDLYYEANLFPSEESEVTITAVKEWLKSLPIYNLQPVECGSDTLNESHITEIERAVETMKTPVNSKTISMKIKPALLFMPGDHQGGLIPDEHADYFLFDRVVNVASNGAVPFGLRGTVTGIAGDGMDNKTMYEVVFDKEFLGGMTLRCSSNRAYRLPPSCLLNLSYGKRWENYQSQTKQSLQPNVKSNPSYASAAATPNYFYDNRGFPLKQDQPDYGYYVGQPYVYSKESSYGTRSMEQVREKPPSSQQSNPKRLISQDGRQMTGKDKGPQVVVRKKEANVKTDNTKNEFDLMLQSMQKQTPPTSKQTPPTATSISSNAKTTSIQKISTKTADDNEPREKKDPDPHPSLAGPLQALAKLKLTDPKPATSQTSSIVVTSEDHSKYSNIPLTKNSAPPCSKTNHFAPSVAAVFELQEQQDQIKLRTEQLTKNSTEPVTKTGNEPVTKTGSKPVTKTGSEPVTKTGREPVTKTGSEPVTKTGSEPVTKTGSKPVTKTSSESVTKTDNEPVSPRSQFRLKQEADLKHILGIQHPLHYPMPRGPTSSGTFQPRGPSHPQPRAPIMRTPIMRTDYKPPLLPPPQGFLLPHHNMLHNSPTPYYPYPIGHHGYQWPPPGPSYIPRGYPHNYPYPMGYHGHPHSLPVNTHPRGPKPPPSVSSFPLNPTSLPFTPLQVQLRHGSKSQSTKPHPPDPNEEPENKENKLSPQSHLSSPPVEDNTTLQTSPSFSPINIDLKPSQQSDLTIVTNTTEWLKDEEIVEALQTSEPTNDTNPCVVGEVVIST